MLKKVIIVSLMTVNAMYAIEMMPAMIQGAPEGEGPTSSAIPAPRPGMFMGKPGEIMGKPTPFGPVGYPMPPKGILMHRGFVEEPAPPFIGHGPAVIYTADDVRRLGLEPVRPTAVWKNPRIFVPERINHIIMELKKLFEETRDPIFVEAIKTLETYNPNQGRRPAQLPHNEPMTGQMHYTYVTDTHGCTHKIGNNGSMYTFDTVIKCPTAELCKKFSCGNMQALTPMEYMKRFKPEAYEKMLQERSEHKIHDKKTAGAYVKEHKAGQR